MVISIDKDNKKIALSIKSVGQAEERGQTDSYKAETFKTATLADKFKGFGEDN